MGVKIPAGTENPSLPIYCRALTGAALTGKVAADFTELWYMREGGAKVDVDQAGITEVAAGEYRHTFPTAAAAIGANYVTIGGEVDGGVVLGIPIELDTSGTTGTGARTVTFTVTDATTAAAIEGATVRLYRTGSQDRTGPTNASGVVALVCDVDATWSYTVSHALYGGASGAVVVDGNEAVPVALTALSWPASTRPNTVTLRYTVIDDADYLPCGAGEGTVQIRMKTAPTTDGFAWGKDARSETTDANGVVQFTEVPQGCTLLVKCGASTSSGEWFEVAIPSDATSPYDGGEILGSVP